MKILRRTQFGNPILRQKARPLKQTEITSAKTQALIQNMHHTLVAKKIGVGLAAPQVGESVALAVITIRPTKHRPAVKLFDLVLINPEITKSYGYRTQMWEGCLSAGASGLFAKVPRYKKIRVSFFDQTGRRHHKQFEGLRAQVIQHEIDHLNGVLFVDRVKDTKTYMTFSEYRRTKKQNLL